MTAGGVTLLGEKSRSGVYLLRIELRKASPISVGKFDHGQIYNLQAGMYLYLGTARNNTLAARLIRHTSRNSGKPHAIQLALLEALQKAGFPVKTKKEKKLHWHVDHLIELPDAEVKGVIGLRTDRSLERPLGQWVMALPETEIFAPGLGASDVPGNTHLLHLKVGPVWWDTIAERLVQEFLDII